ncbi:hypothetical protein OROMI_010970 [Orobanche minor]
MFPTSNSKPAIANTRFCKILRPPHTFPPLRHTSVNLPPEFLLLLSLRRAQIFYGFNHFNCKGLREIVNRQEQSFKFQLQKGKGFQLNLNCIIAMNQYFKPVSKYDSSSIVIGPEVSKPQASLQNVDIIHDCQPPTSSKEGILELNLENLPSDLRPDIMSYPPNLIEQYHGHDAFVSGGFQSWRKKERLRVHVGDRNSEHTRCRMLCENLMNQSQHIEVTLSRVSKQSKIDYLCRLNASIKSIRYLMMQAMAFRGHDESEESLDQGNFLELLKLLASCNEYISKVVLKNAPQNHKLTSSDVQKDIISAIAVETTSAIVSDIGSSFFSILVDECHGVSVKEQMGVVVRYVNGKGCVIERLLGLVHDTDTSAISLEKGIDSLFSTHGLSISSLRGQGYDVASNMRGEFKGLKSLILKRNPNAYFIHCFAHQLQLTIVAVSKKHICVGSFFNTISQ